MNPALDKPMRKVEITASLITILLEIIFQNIFTVIHGLHFFSYGLFILEDVSVILILLLFLFGKFRNTPWDKAVGVLYAVMIIPHIEKLPSALRSLSFYDQFDLPWFILTSVTSAAYQITFIICAVICMLIYLNVLRFRKRAGLLILMYAFIVFGALNFIFVQKSLSSLLTIIWGICFHKENAETGSPKGKAARTAILFFIPLTFFLVIDYFIKLLRNSAYPEESYTNYLNILETAASDSHTSLVFAPLVFICIMLFPLLLFDKKFESRETT